MQLASQVRTSTLFNIYLLISAKTIGTISPVSASKQAPPRHALAPPPPPLEPAPFIKAEPVDEEEAQYGGGQTVYHRAGQQLQQQYYEHINAAAMGNSSGKIVIC